MRLPKKSNRMRAAISSLALVFLAGCNVGPKYQPPTAPAVTAYTPQPQPARQPQRRTRGRGAAFRFLRHDSCRVVDAVPLAGTQQHDGAGAGKQPYAGPGGRAAATKRKEELNARTGATKYPTVTGNASVEEEQPNLTAYGIPFPNPSPFTLLNGSVAVSYALDIFGANRRAIEGLKAERDYQNWQLEGARLMLAGNVVSAAIRQAELRKQIELTKQLLAIDEHELAITEARNQAGGASDAEVESRKSAWPKLRPRSLRSKRSSMSSIISSPC